MPPYRDYAEWHFVKERVGQRLDQPANEGARGDDFEQLFDSAIRHRFGMLISQAKLKLSSSLRPSPFSCERRRGPK